MDNHFADLSSAPSPTTGSRPPQRSPNHIQDVGQIHTGMWLQKYTDKQPVLRMYVTNIFYKDKKWQISWKSAPEADNEYIAYTEELGIGPDTNGKWNLRNWVEKINPPSL